MKYQVRGYRKGDLSGTTDEIILGESNNKTKAISAARNIGRVRKMEVAAVYQGNMRVSIWINPEAK